MNLSIKNINYFFRKIQSYEYKNIFKLFELK